VDEAIAPLKNGVEWFRDRGGWSKVRAPMNGQPFTRMVVVLGVVVGVTFCSALLFQKQEMKRIYGLLR